MKRFGLLSIVFLLLLVNANVSFAREMVHEGQALAQTEIKDTYRQELSHPPINNVLWMSQKFGVSSSWLHNEMTKGYMLADIYGG
ncbi:uncharacterized conserved protein [Paenibacillus popilliae ATCC 14706]|uniref:Uncharacterized conserved protein n=1 Tax=Paenibacillus popilliae ATCC 14706 TaxID=1212764 RepID=M9LRA5_PAEPP|nr:uncharacterized conserved protein [Paenibacillus popilliae ATCC 14706]